MARHSLILRWAAALLCGAALLSLTACGSDGPKQIQLKEGAQFTVAVTEEPALLLFWIAMLPR